MDRMDKSDIRNFCIVAHIDHGKSTLADRILEQTQSVSLREMEDQLLDNMDLERERGITIKAHAVTLVYHADGRRGLCFQPDRHPRPRGLQLRGFPVPGRLRGGGAGGGRLAGHRGPDPGQHLSGGGRRAGDRPGDQQDRPAQRRPRHGSATRSRTSSASRPWTRPRVSAKTGHEHRRGAGTRLCTGIPAPQGDETRPLQALIFDSYYDAYKGVIVYVRVKDGHRRARGHHPHDGHRRGIQRGGGAASCGPPRLEPADEPVRRARWATSPPPSRTVRRGPGGRHRHPGRTAPPPSRCPATGRCSPWCSAASIPPTAPITPTCGTRWKSCSSTTPPSPLSRKPPCALGFGFRCGFLGLLHMEIIQERLEREYNLDLITTAPSVVYKHHHDRRRQLITIDNPTNYPDPAVIAERRGADRQRPHLRPLRICGQHYGAVPGAAGRVQGHEISRRPTGWTSTTSCRSTRSSTTSSTRSKSRTRGYASFDYELMRLPGNPSWSSWISCSTARSVDALSFIIHADKAYPRAQEDGGKAQGEDSAPAVRGAHPGLHRRARSLPGKRSRPCARTCWPSATAATSPGKRSCWKSRRKAKSGCASWARWRCPRRRLWPC